MKQYSKKRNCILGQLVIRLHMYLNICIFQEEKEMAISKDMIIAEVLNEHQELVPVFMNSGLHCLGCAMAHGESIEEACAVHGLDCDALVTALNTALGENA